MIAEVLADGKLSERRKFKAQAELVTAGGAGRLENLPRLAQDRPMPGHGSYCRLSWCISAQISSVAENEGLASGEGSPAAGDARSALRRRWLFFLLELEDARMGLIGHLGQ